MKIPEWAKWLAADVDGDLYAYEREPKNSAEGYWFVGDEDGNSEFIANCKPDPNWKDSLRYIGGTTATARDEGSEHYAEMDIQPWDVIDTWPREQQIGFYRGNLLKYTMRMGSKDIDQQEIKKAEHYARKLQEVLSREWAE